MYIRRQSTVISAVSAERALSSRSIPIPVYKFMPFFSNTYRYVSYVTSVDGRLLEYSGDAVVEFVSERNLAGLLDMTDIESGNYGATGGYEEN